MVILSCGQTATEMEKERFLSGTTTFLTRLTEERGTPIHPVVRLCLGGWQFRSCPNWKQRFGGQPGVKLGMSTANHTQMYSGGGDISIKGLSTATGLADDRDEAGVYQWGRMTMKSGRGSITMNGTSSEYSGVGFTDPLTDTDSGTKQLIMKSAKTSGTAIQITGLSTSGKGVSFNYLNPKEILSLGGGQIIVNGTGGGAGNHGVSSKIKISFLLPETFL